MIPLNTVFISAKSITIETSKFKVTQNQTFEDLLVIMWDYIRTYSEYDTIIIVIDNRYKSISDMIDTFTTNKTDRLLFSLGDYICILNKGLARLNITNGYTYFNKIANR